MTLLSEIHHCSWLKSHWTLSQWNVVHMYRLATESKTSKWARMHKVKCIDPNMHRFKYNAIGTTEHRVYLRLAAPGWLTSQTGWSCLLMRLLQTVKDGRHWRDIVHLPPKFASSSSSSAASTTVNIFSATSDITFIDFNSAHWCQTVSFIFC